jgi:hypothetical protein
VATKRPDVLSAFLDDASNGLYGPAVEQRLCPESQSRCPSIEIIHFAAINDSLGE